MQKHGFDAIQDQQIVYMQRAKFPSSVSRAAGRKQPAWAREREDTHWGVVLNGSILVHALNVNSEWQIFCEDYTANPSIVLDVHADVERNQISWKQFDSYWQPPTTIANCHDLCVSIYQYFGLQLKTGKQILTKKGVGVTLATAGVGSILVGVFIVSNPVGWIVGGAAAFFGGIGMAATA